MTAVVGYTGFVGSNLLQFINCDFFYNSKNFNTAMNKHFNTIYFAGIPAVKWYANKYPEEDRTIIDNIIKILDTITADRFILISTIDVYDNTHNQMNEDDIINYENNHSYGRNRYLFEEYIIKRFENIHIIRLPALFGYGLKKNVLYDLLNNNMIDKISPNTYFQWYDLNWLKDDIKMIIEKNIKIINLFTEPILTNEIIQLFNYDKTIFTGELNVKYDLTTKYTNVSETEITRTFTNAKYIKMKEEVLNSIKKFINFYKIDKSNLVVSNICLNNVSNFQFACLLKLYGINNVQIAPTTLISWDNIDKINFNDYLENSIKIYSFQSLTFGLSDFNIFINTDFFIEHMKKIIDIAHKYNVNRLVFGSPKHRYSNSNTDDIKFINIFRILGDYCNNKNIIICIEPNSRKYGCNFITTIKEANEIVNHINNKNVKVMIDTGNIMMENDDTSNINIINLYNVDISMPYLANEFIKQDYHLRIKNILENDNYKYKYNLEMCNIYPDSVTEELNILTKSIIEFISIFS